MKIEITYCTIQSNHILAVPEPTHSEIVEVDSWKDLDKYIEKQSDLYGNRFKKDKSFGFRYISGAGGVKVKRYKPPKINKI